jgi:hypothetical protein
MEMRDIYTDARLLTDRQLVEAARHGQRATFDELVRRHRPRCVEVAGFFLWESVWRQQTPGLPAPDSSCDPV